MKILAVLFILPLANALYSIPMESHQKCDYKHKTQTYNCKYIRDVFPKIFYGNYNLKCELCHIPIFKKETFPFDNNLVSMNLTDSKITNITSNSFAALSTLQFLYLQHNNIRNVSRDGFNGLRQIYELHLEHNELSELTPGFMNGFEANSIIISHNKLSEIPENVFQGIFGAMSLDLSHNHIHTVLTESFNYLSGLEYLDLQHNNLCNIPLGTFKHLKLLTSLNLSHNRFKKFNHGLFSALSSLQKLNLSSNYIIEFDPSILIPMSLLTHLDISNNGLHYVDGIPLHTNAPNLRMLGISDNLWNCMGLINFVQYLKSIGISIIEHDKYEVTNVNGVACLENHITNEKIPFKTFYKLAKESTASAYQYC